MGKLLTMDSRVSCGHNPAGFVVPQSTAKLTLGGRPVLVQSSITTIGPGCLAQKQGDIPCATVVSITAGLSVKLRVGGAAVLLDSLAGSTNGTINGEPGALTLVSVQGKVTAR
jgi:hypothetical protein